MQPNHSKQGGREEDYKSYLLADKFCSLVYNQAIFSRKEKRKVINLTSCRQVLQPCMQPSHSQQGERKEGYKSYLLADKFCSLVCNQAIFSREGKRKVKNLTSCQQVLQPCMQPNHSQQGGREEGFKSYPLANTFSSLLCTQTILSREGERKVLSLTPLPTRSPAFYATKPFSAGRERGGL